MTQEEKDLLLKDLCARLQYGVKGQFQKSDDVLLSRVTIAYHHLITASDRDGMVLTGELVPYLFSLSSMTEEQKQHYHWLQCHALDALGNLLCFDCYDSLDWLNKNHFDYRGLIEKGLAIDATGLNIY